ncbi:MAG: retropepsin-like aspartic protease [Bacteroidales bacterium]|jgi:hypothetical protein|nr:retropepsin-like aspartic protease [Bacteroidales bacterium]HOI32083.1 retropepsin-like aspartic protease [Bacteroidales bacterium]
MKKAKYLIGICFSMVVCTILRAQGTSIPFEYYQGLIFMEIETTNKDTLFCLFDTGAEISAVNEATSNKLKLPVIDSTQVTGSNATIDVKIVCMTKLTLKNHKVDSIAPTKRNLSHSLTPNNRILDMILGYDFFKESIIEIDFSKHEISIIKDTALLTYTAYIPFSLDHNIPRFSGMASGKVILDFRLDTGASLFDTDDIYINVTTDDWQRIQEINPNLKPEFHLIATGINNEQIELPVIQLDKVAIDILEIDTPYIIVQPKQGYFASPDAVGFVSNNLLSKYGCVAIDYINNRLYYLPLKKQEK